MEEPVLVGGVGGMFQAGQRLQPQIQEIIILVQQIRGANMVMPAAEAVEPVLDQAHTKAVVVSFLPLRVNF